LQFDLACDLSLIVDACPLVRRRCGREPHHYRLAIMVDGSIPTCRHAGIVDCPHGFVVMAIGIQCHYAHAGFCSGGSCCGCSGIISHENKAIANNSNMRS
jgi:hypothetical protein